MMLHQDASTHRWVPGAVWDLVVTMDDATGEHTSMFFCAQEGTASSFHGIGQTVARYGLFASLYTDRGSHYFLTPQAGGKVDKQQLTEVGRALKQLGIEHIAAYSPEARGRSERAFQTHQGRLPLELARAGITCMDAANQYLEQAYREAHNREFGVSSTLSGTAYVPFISGSLPDILCEHHERTVGNDNCVSFEGLSLQLPADAMRYHYARAKVRVHRYVDDTLGVFHGPRKLAGYDAQGNLTNASKEVPRAAAWRPAIERARGRPSRFGLRPTRPCRPRTINPRKRTTYLLPNRTVLFTPDRLALGGGPRPERTPPHWPTPTGSCSRRASR